MKNFLICLGRGCILSNKLTILNEAEELNNKARLSIAEANKHSETADTNYWTALIFCLIFSMLRNNGSLFIFTAISIFCFLYFGYYSIRENKLFFKKLKEAEGFSNRAVELLRLT